MDRTPLILIAYLVFVFEPFAAVNRLRIPPIFDGERASVTSTRIYLAAFQSYVISVVDPNSGHALHEIDVQSQQAGIAVSPDGRRLYVLDGRDYDEGHLRVLDTIYWRTLFEVPVAGRTVRLFGNPLCLSGDGRWLQVQNYSYDAESVETNMFDTRELRFRSDVSFDPQHPRNPQLAQMAGLPGHPRIYVPMEGTLRSFDSLELTHRWTSSRPLSRSLSLVLSPDQQRLYGLSSDVPGCPCPDGVMQLHRWALLLTAWEPTTGRMVGQNDLIQAMSTSGARVERGNRQFLVISPDGDLLYVAWGDQVWSFNSKSFEVKKKLALPFMVESMVSSIDGTKLYLLTNKTNNKQGRPGLWTVAVPELRLIRWTQDWPVLRGAFMYSAPAPQVQR